MRIRNPRTGKLDYTIAPMDEAALSALTQRARAAQTAWAARAAQERGEVLLQLADAVERHADAIADALTIDTGRAAISRMEVDGTAKLIRRWVTSAPALMAAAQSEIRATSIPGIATQTRLVPYPLLGVISPWNFPLTLALIDAIPALMAGCAVVIKPSEVTPRFIRPLMVAIAEVADLTDILTLIEGDGATGAAFIPLVDYVAFTGSVPTGRKVAAAAAAAFIPASLELGGKDPMIIAESADPVWAASVALRASVLNTGQACQSIERIYVAREIAGPFLDALVTAAQAAGLNYPDINAGDIGPFIFARQADIVAAQIADATAKGATLLTGGVVEELGGGLYLRPTVLTNVTPDMAVMADETFGPVLPVTVVENMDEAVAHANGGEYGLSAAVLAGSIEEADAIARRLNAGAVSLNDGSLTSMVWEGEKSSFGLSGMGHSRMGDSGLMRFFRRQLLIRQEGTALPLAAYAEDAKR